jgi:TPR repeat protein
MKIDDIPETKIDDEAPLHFTANHLPLPLEIQKEINPDCPICGAPNAKSESEEMQRRLRLANAGHALSQYSIGADYKKGSNGMPQDVKKACEFWMAAANQGLPEAELAIAFHFKEGKGVLQSYSEAKRRFEILVAQGNAIAQHSLGRFYQYGFGVAPDLQKAGDLFRLSAEQDYLPAVHDFSVWLDKQGNTAQSIDWNLKAANNERYLSKHQLAIAACQYMAARSLDFLYADKFLVPGESKLPIIRFWIDRAAKNGFTKAKDYLKWCEEKYVWSYCANCQKPAPTVACSACKAASYCSKKCQVQHWKAGHKIDCKSVPTDVVYPQMAAYSKYACAFCSTVFPALLCSGCMCAYYCGGECQKKHWTEKNHKNECKKIKRQTLQQAASS